MLRTQVELRRQGAPYPGVKEFEVKLDGQGLRVGIVMARFNLEICEGLLAACMGEFAALGVASTDIELVTVPGALEIPLVLQAMANSGRLDALVALGAVIRGDTYHFELVSNEMGAGITRIGLDHQIPVANGVLTTEDEGQARIRMKEKGTDCARAAVEMARLLQALK